MARYIVNKQMDFSKANNLDDFISIGKVVQNFISSVYKANWDTLYTAYINQKQQSQHQSFPGEHWKNPVFYSHQISEGGQSDLKILQEQQTDEHESSTSQVLCTSFETEY